MLTTQSKSKLKNSLVTKGRTLYFDEEFHKYTDNLGCSYISTTTLIGNYYSKFDKDAIAKACERIGKTPNHPKYLKYKNKTAKQLLFEWEEETKLACNKGSKKHNYLESTIKSSNGYNINAKGFINGRIYTIDDVIKGHNYGQLSLDYFKQTGIDQTYPQIYNIICDLVKAGFKIYAEIGVYDAEYGVSGLIDILLIRGKEFIILDWKTNKAPIRFESGYYEKDKYGKLVLDNFILTPDKTFHAPIQHLPDSVGNHYTMQLSTYDYLVESFGFRNITNILCHIRRIEDFNINTDEETEEVTFIDIKYLKNEVRDMFDDYASKHHFEKRLF